MSKYGEPISIAGHCRDYCESEHCHLTWLSSGQFTQGSGFDEETAQRHVDTWNACRGIPDPKAAMDAAREALGMLLDIEERSSKTDPDVMPCDEYIAEAYAKARAALALLTPEDET